MSPPLRLVTAAEPSDAELCRAFVDGNREAFGVLVRRYQQTVFRVVCRYTGSPEEARDLTQRAFVQAFESVRTSASMLASAEGERPFRAWLLHIAINLGKNHSRDAARWRRSPLEAIEAEKAIFPEAVAALDRVQTEQAIRTAVNGLPKRQREVFTLRVDAEMPFAEIATVLGISEGNAKSHFHFAFRRVRDAVRARLALDEKEP
jgi:RNA polymerase sigma-70 factor (ECF subfamily)